MIQRLLILPKLKRLPGSSAGSEKPDSFLQEAKAHLCLETREFVVLIPIFAEVE
jgi:hypothetical protein